MNSMWSRVLRGDSSVRSIVAEEVTRLQLQTHVSAPIVNFAVNDYISTKNLPPLSRFEEFALAASAIALQDSGILSDTHARELHSMVQPKRIGVAIGTGIGGIEEVAQSAQTLQDKGARKLSAYTLPKMLTNLAAGLVSIHFRLYGPNHCVSTACTTGAHSIGDAFHFVRSGLADVMVCGSTEASVSPLSLALFNRINALSCNRDPSTASQPFGATRDGFVMGEGAAIVILETLESALQRDATIYAEVVGYGASSDAHHVTSPPKDGAGAYQCMQKALEQAAIQPNDVGYINAHATSTVVGDNAEVQAITRLFSQPQPQRPRPCVHDTNWLVDEYNRHTAHRPISEWNQAAAHELLTQIAPLLERNGPVISSNKGTFGHTLGAAGAIEALCTILALHTQHVPPTAGISTSTVDPLFYDVPIVTLDNWADTQKNVQRQPLNYAISNSFGFGGSNASLVFRRWNPNAHPLQ